MLVVPRKKYESIVINNDIIITVMRICDDKVMLAVVAPKHVPVHRQEVYDAIHSEFAAGALSVDVNPTLAEADDLLPDLIVECRLAMGSHESAQFTPEGGFLFLDNSPRRNSDRTMKIP